MITRQMVAQYLTDYLNHRISLEKMVDWAENAMVEGGAEQNYARVIMHSLGRMAAADVKEFGLMWDDCEKIMRDMGFTLKVDWEKAA